MTIYLDTMVQFGNLLPYGMGNDDECHPLDEIEEDPITQDDIRRFEAEEEALIRHLDGEDSLLIELDIDYEIVS